MPEIEPVDDAGMTAAAQISAHVQMSHLNELGASQKSRRELGV